MKCAICNTDTQPRQRVIVARKAVCWRCAKLVSVEVWGAESKDEARAARKSWADR